MLTMANYLNKTRLPEAPADAPDEVRQTLNRLKIFQNCMLLDGKENEEYMSAILALAYGTVQKNWRMNDKVAENIRKLFKGEHTCKRGRHMALIHAGILANIREMQNMTPCKVCDQLVDEAHKCQGCQQFVHSIICSVPVGEEGHGQKVMCHLCSKAQEEGVGDGKGDPKTTEDMPPKEDQNEEYTQSQKKDDKEENKEDTQEDDNEENRDGDPTKDAHDKQPAVEFQIAISMDLMEEISMLFSRQAEKLQPIRNLCDATDKLAKQMANGIEKKHWLLNPDTTRSVGSLLEMDMGEKRTPAITSIISGLNATLQKNIDLMEKAAFCPCCYKPAARTNVCDNCNRPTHFDCGDRKDGQPEFFCNICCNKTDAELKAIKEAVAAQEAIKNAAADATKKTAVVKDNNPSKKDATPATGQADKPIEPKTTTESDYLGKKTTRKLFERDSFHSVVNLNDADLGWDLTSDWADEWQPILSSRLKDRNKEITPEDWAGFFNQALIDDAPSDAFKRDFIPLTVDEKFTMKQTAMLLACMAPSRLGPDVHYFDNATKGFRLAKTNASIMWMAAFQVIGSPWSGVRAFGRLSKAYIHRGLLAAERKKRAELKVAELRDEGNEAKLHRVDRLLSNLDSSTEFFCCLSVLEVWSEMTEIPRLALMMPWSDSLHEKTDLLKTGFPTSKPPNPDHTDTLMELWSDRDAVTTLPKHMQNVARNKPKIGWKQFHGLWKLGRQLSSDFWFSSPGLSKEDVLAKMEDELSHTTSAPTLTKAWEDYKARHLKVLEADAKQAQANLKAQKVAEEEEKIEQTIQQTRQKLKQISTGTRTSVRSRRTNQKLPNANSREAVEAKKKLATLEKQKDKKGKDRKRRLAEAKAAAKEKAEAAKKPAPVEAKPSKRTKKEFPSLFDIAGSGHPNSCPPVRRGKRLAYAPPGTNWKAAANSLTSNLSCCHELLKSEWENLDLNWSELQNTRTDLDTKRMIADYQFLVDAVESFKKESNREPTKDEMAGIIRDSNSSKSPTLDVLLGDVFVQNSIIDLGLLDTSEFLDEESGQVIKKNIKVKHLRPSILSWMSKAEAADLCWHLKCIEYIKKKDKGREFKVLIRQNFAPGLKEKMLSVFDTLVAAKMKK